MHTTNTHKNIIYELNYSSEELRFAYITIFKATVRIAGELDHEPQLKLHE